MKTGFLIIPLFLMSAMCWSQDRHSYQKLIAEGNRYFVEEQYHLAIDLYNKALILNIGDPAVDYNLAECYRKTFNYIEAEAYYLKVLYTDQTAFPLSLFYYALMLKLNGNVITAIERFDQFISLHGQNTLLQDFIDQAIIEKAGCDIVQAEFGSPVTFKTEPVKGINSPYNDFAPAFRNPQTLVVTSSRVKSNRSLIDERDGEAFSDNYYFEKADDIWEDKTHKGFFMANSVYHDGSGVFTKSGDRYYFTVCEARCAIYETHLDNSKWTTPVALNDRINPPDSESKQPAISPGGDTLYFASNRFGGYGQFDIWMSIDTGHNQWSAPVNAGGIINTQANELTPAITDVPGVLFFSSTGHPGYGGFDLFVAKSTSNSDTVVYNLNYPFNSIRDDCFISFNGQETFWSSNREGGVGGFDVYASNKASAIGLLSKLTLKNRNDSRSVVLTSRTAQAENITLLASRNEETIDYNNLTYERKAIVNHMVENQLNNVANDPSDYPELTGDAFERLHEISYLRFQALLLKQKYASTLLTEVVPNAEVNGAMSITGELTNSHTGSPISFAKVLLTNSYGEILKITRTNHQGQFRFTGVGKDIKLFLRLGSGFGRQANAIAKNIQTMESEKQNALYVENIYFDFDHYIIRPEASRVLTELASYLKSNVGAQVEIYAFADDRGSNSYNFELTQKRGEAVVAFLAKEGVDETSLAIIPRGKQSTRHAASEIQRQYNRRAEFYINGVRESIHPSVKTYILKKEADWGIIAKLTGISEEKLKNLNGASTETVKAFQPIRLPLNAKSISDELFYVGI